MPFKKKVCSPSYIHIRFHLIHPDPYAFCFVPLIIVVVPLSVAVDNLFRMEMRSIDLGRLALLFLVVNLLNRDELKRLTLFLLFISRK
jgi:hypothetical protein